MKKNLARYKVPREFVFIDELPRNATGKVLKRELVEDEDGGEGREVGVPHRYCRVPAPKTQYGRK